MRRLLATAAFAALMTAPALAYQVYPGCSIPGAAGSQWWVDPVGGKTPAAGGNGSEASPWNSLNGVMSGSWGNNGYSIPGNTRPMLSSQPYIQGVAEERGLASHQL